MYSTMQVVRPTLAERDCVDQVIFEEPCTGVITGA
jgi:hypothetical protein